MDKKNTSNSNDDVNLMLVTYKSIYSLPIKLTLFIFISYLFVSSDIWINMLIRWNIIESNMGIMNQQSYIFNAFILSLSFIIIFIFIEREIL